MGSARPISLGDNVRIRSARCTVECGLAGLVGQVFGETTPSVTGVSVIGQLTSDFALNVCFSSHPGEYWFAQELLEFIDHAPGMAMTIRGASKRWVRTADGDWAEEELNDQNAATKPWWKFW